MCGEFSVFVLRCSCLSCHSFKTQLADTAGAMCVLKGHQDFSLISPEEDFRKTKVIIRSDFMKKQLSHGGTWCSGLHGSIPIRVRAFLCGVSV